MTATNVNSANDVTRFGSVPVTLGKTTSANLTCAGMEYNMELGVLIKSGDQPLELHRRLEALISTKVIEKIDKDKDQ